LIYPYSPLFAGGSLGATTRILIDVPHAVPVGERFKPHFIARPGQSNTVNINLPPMINSDRLCRQAATPQLIRN